MSKLKLTVEVDHGNDHGKAEVVFEVGRIVMSTIRGRLFPRDHKLFGELLAVLEGFKDEYENIGTRPKVMDTAALQNELDRIPNRAGGRDSD